VPDKPVIDPRTGEPMTKSEQEEVRRLITGAVQYGPNPMPQPKTGSDEETTDTTP
jgi:hypothetical protein